MIDIFNLRPRSESLPVNLHFLHIKYLSSYGAKRTPFEYPLHNE